MVEEVREQRMMPYDAYYVSSPFYEYQSNLYHYIPPYYAWPAYGAYPAYPSPSYPAHLAYPPADVSQAVAAMPEELQEGSGRPAVVDSKVLQQFMNDHGQVDIQKMLQTVGQFADTVQQVSPVIKQLNELIRSFRT